MQFVSVSADGYVLDPRAQTMLQSMPAPLTIVSVIGRYRTGKSSLLNSLIGGASDTFRTSSTVQAQTKGLMVHQLDESTLLIDTEGLGSLEVSREHDASIFALAMLISSGCFFNNLGAITSQAVDDLHLASKLASLLCKHAQFNKQLPALVWLMRDFGLELVDGNDLPISADTYFEQCLDKAPGTKSEDLRALFPSRRCLPLARPALVEADLRHMQNLRPEFLQDIGRVHDLLRQFPPKHLGHQPLSGEQLCSLIQSLCSVLNSEALPDLEDVWNHVARQARTKARETAHATFLGLSSVSAGVAAAYAAYTALMLEETVSGDETCTLLCELLSADTRGQEFEVKYLDTKRALELQLTASSLQHNDAEARVKDSESHLASSHRKMARLVDESLEMQAKLQELQASAHAVPSEPTELLDVLETLQNKHKDLKAEMVGTRERLDDVVQKMQAKDRTISDQGSRLATEHKNVQDMQANLMLLESRLADGKTGQNQDQTEIAIWKTRYEDLVSRNDKKRKLNDDSYTELISLKAESNFLRNRHEDDATKLQKVTKENAAAALKIQSLQIKLALEIGK